jgi:hypothetical protein
MRLNFTRRADTQGFFLLVAVLFAWKIIFMWRGQSNIFYQDEANWVQNVSKKGFVANALTLDSGYPTPILRAGFWITIKFFSENPTAVHLVAALIASLCSASVILLLPFEVGFKRRISAALAIGIFPSFDLLLWFNLSYYFYIPTLIICMRFALRKRPTNLFDYVLLTLLITSSAKPQLLASLMLIFLVKSRDYSFARWVTQRLYLFVLTASMILIGRFQSDSLPIDLTLEKLAYLGSALFVIPLAILFPIVSIGLTGFLRFLQLDWLFLVTQIALLTTGVLALSKGLIMLKNSSSTKFFHSDALKYVLIASLPVYSSIFVFLNSGWSFDYIWNAACTICLFQRHFFSIFVLGVVFIAFAVKSSRKVDYILLGISVQLAILSLSAYHQLYSPV